MIKQIAILGSTGSIGKSLLRIIQKDKKKFKIILLTAKSNYKELFKQAKIYNCKNLIITDKKSNLEINNARMDFEFYTSMTRVREKVFVLNRNKRYEDFLDDNFEKY